MYLQIGVKVAGDNRINYNDNDTILCTAAGGCYFPVEVQGEYVTQSMIDREIAYTRYIDIYTIYTISTLNIYTA